jgi:rod shape-determining protein MreD
VIRPSLGQQADIAWRAALPVGLTILLLFAALLSWHLPRLGTVASALVLISVFFWTVHQPGLMTMWGVLSIGLLHDFLMLAPFGVGLLVLLVVHGVALWQRKPLTGMPFLLIWAVFGLVAAGATILTWLLVSFRQETLVNPVQAFNLFLLEFVCYPVLAYVFAWIERRLLPTD